MGEFDFDDAIKEREQMLIKDRSWLASRGWDMGCLWSDEELLRAKSEEYEKLFKELGWYKISSLSVINVILGSKTGKYKFYRNNLKKYNVPHLRYYNPNKNVFHTFESAHHFARECGENYSLNDLKGIDSIITDELHRKNIKLLSNDVLIIGAFGRDTDSDRTDFHYKYIDKMNYYRFKENERYCMAQWIKKARKEWR